MNTSIRKVEELGHFTNFRIGTSYLVVSLLQYADDTLLVGEATMNNLLIMKTILRYFELALSLRVNFSKSSMMGIMSTIPF